MATEVEIEMTNGRKLTLKLERASGEFLKVTGPPIPMLPNEFLFTRDSSLELAAAIRSEME